MRLSVTGAVAGLPEVLQLSAYRIVQEALSNVVRHAAGAPATVDVAAAGALRIEVVNARPATPASHGDAGHGLVGLRERAVLLGGTFEVDQPDGGWRIRATLPVPAPVSIKPSWPWLVSSSAPAGVSATRYSSGLISFATPTLKAAQPYSLARCSGISRQARGPGAYSCR